jgi:hypothetical protein
MPIPQRRAAEERDAFIGRCISELSAEYPQDQASAICYLQLKKTNMAEETAAISPEEIEECLLSLRGQNPSYVGAGALKICIDRLTIAKQAQG